MTAVDEPSVSTSADGTDGRVLGPGYARLTIGVFAIVFLFAFEAMAVATAMPIAVSELNGVSSYAWAFTGFAVATMFATVLAGQLSDRLGPFWPLLAGAVSFLLGLVVAGAATGMPVFILGRMLQGLGAGGSIVAIYVVIARAYPAALRPKAFTALSAAWVLPAIVGPAVAGVVAENLTWRLVFLGCLPLAIVPLGLILPRARSLPAVEGKPIRAALIWLSLAASVGVGLLQYAGQHLVWRSLAIALVGLVLLGPALPRLLPPGTLRFARGLPSVMVARAVLSGALMGVEAFLPLMLVKHRGMSAATAGLVLTASAITWTFGSWLQARPGLRMPRYMLVRLGAASVLLATLIILGTLHPAVPSWVAIVGWLFAGLGMGLSISSLSVLLMEYSPEDQQGVNSAAIQLSDALGTMVMMGLGGVIFAALHTSVGVGLALAPAYGLMAGLLLLGVFVAGRLRLPAGTAGVKRQESRPRS